MLALMVSTALATEWVVDLDGETEPESVAKVLGLAEAPTPITATDLAQRPARLLGGGSLDWCDSAPTSLEDLAGAMETAEREMAYMRYESAARTLGRAFDDLQCLGDPIDPNLAGRLFYLRGLVAHRSGFEEQARRAFSAALVFQPELVWDDAFPPKALDLFEAARAAADSVETVPITLQPAGTVIIDGVEHSDLELAPGTHLLQLQDQTATLQVFPGTRPTLVLPALYEGIEDFPSVESQATLLLLADEDTLHVVHEGHVWSPGPEGYEDRGRLPRARPERPAAEPREPRPQAPRDGPRWLAPGGGAVALGGAAVGTLGLLLTRDAATDARTATSWTDHQEVVGQARTRVRIAQVGYGVAAVGAVLGATGLVLTSERGWTLAPVPGGLLLTVDR